LRIFVFFRQKDLRIFAFFRQKYNFVFKLVRLHIPVFGFFYKNGFLLNEAACMTQVFTGEPKIPINLRRISTAGNLRGVLFATSWT